MDTLYLMENTNMLINSSVVETILKNIYIFNNVSFAFKLQVIKALPKSNMTIVQLDIWNIQSRSKAKYLINKYFNVGSFIAIVQRPNINSSILQYKNYQKWEYTTFAYQIQSLRQTLCILRLNRISFALILSSI